ncbi:MAG: hypothetical protein ACI379_06760 [Nocardioides sp.]|uniref:phage holin family protein n=1 Tax=Nocardioides sp. TaxID=35761 RepID=UPI003F0890E1
MIRLLVSTLVFLGSAAIGLLVAASALDGVRVEAAGFVLTVLIYAVIQTVISPFLTKVAAQRASAFLGGTGLVATFVALLVATLVGDSLTITGGAATWIASTVIVWLVTAVATLMLPWLLIKAGVKSARARRAG